jgi:hypothetical protein
MVAPVKLDVTLAVDRAPAMFALTQDMRLSP